MMTRYNLAFPYRKLNLIKMVFFRVSVSILIFVAFSVLSNIVSANVLEHDNKPDLNAATHASIWLLPGDGVYIEALQLQNSVNIDVSGMIVRANVKQKFRNVSSLWVEGVYVFPLPENAAVDHFRMLLDGRVIEGQIQEKLKAKKTYEKARRNGQRAGLVEQHRANIFVTKLANIAPGGEISIEIEYQQTLTYRNGHYALRYPLVVGPRYISASKQGFTNPAYDVGDYTETSTNDNNINQSINVSIDAGIPVTKIISTSHAIIIEPLSDNRYVVSLQDSRVRSDRDFLLKWQPELGKLPTATVFNQKHDDYEYSLLTIYPPDDESYSILNIARELVFVLDVSGSMSGTSIKQAKSALRLALERLKPSDKFNIIWFNNEARKIFNNSRQANEYNIRYAKQFVDSLNADGGTEMLTALKLALGIAADDLYLRQVIFITDGNISNERDLFEYIKSNLAESRLFTVGIGSAPNSFFMKRAARAGRGTYTFISNIQEVAEKTNRLFRKLELPALTNVQLSLMGDEIEYFHHPIPDMYIGEPITVLLRGKNLSNSITLKGSIATHEWQQTVFLTQGYDSDGVRTAWAREKISSLSEFYHDAENKNLREYFKNQIVSVSQTNHLVSQFTSLVAVDVTPFNQGGMLYQERIKNNHPHGWSTQQNNNRMMAQISLPQTATTAATHLMFMMIFIVVGLLLNFIRTR